MRLIVSLCDVSGVFVEPWAAAGYECWIVDIQHYPGIGALRRGIRKVGADVLGFQLPKRDIAFVAAFPPCTDLAVSGARHFKRKGLDALIDALMVVNACRKLCEKSGAPWFIENPVSTISTYWRKPDYKFDPCEYAGYLANPADEAYTKRTCLWTGGEFVMPEKHGTEPVGYNRTLSYSPSPRRAELRSVTPRGFSLAVFQANKGI